MATRPPIGTDTLGRKLYAELMNKRPIRRSPPSAAQGGVEKTYPELLQEMRDTYVADKIWPSAVTIIERLQAREFELADAYSELHRDLISTRARWCLLDAVVMTAAQWNPKKIDKARGERAQLDETNSQIAEAARVLAELLRRRSELHNTGHFTSDTLYHVVDAIDRACAANGLYGGWVKEELDALRTRFDLKYWPTLAAIVDVIGLDASAAEAEPTDKLTAAATAGAPRRATEAHFLKAFLQGLKERGRSVGGFLPEGYLPSDSTLGSLTTCALGRSPHAPLDAPYVKRVRQRIRQASTETRPNGRAA